MSTTVSTLGNCFWAPKCAPKKHAFLSTVRPLSIFRFPNLLSRIMATPKAFFALNKNLELMKKLERTLKSKDVIDYDLLEEHGFGCYTFGQGGVGLWIREESGEDKKLFHASFEKLLEGKTLSHKRPTVKPEYQIAFLNLCGIRTEDLDQGNLESALERVEHHKPDLNGIHIIKIGKIPLERIRPHTLIIDPRLKIDK